MPVTRGTLRWLGGPFSRYGEPLRNWMGWHHANQTLYQLFSAHEMGRLSYSYRR